MIHDDHGCPSRPIGRMSERKDLLLGVDGGQTTTKALVVRRDGTVLGAGLGPGGDHFHGPGGFERNRAAIQGAVLAALKAADAPADRIASAALGLTSAPRGGSQGPLVRRIVDEICTPDVLWFDSDFVTNLLGASTGQSGIVVVAGGGSVAYGIDADGHEAICGGLGYLLDVGSAWNIGLDAVRAATRASDLRGPETAILPAVRDHFGLSDLRGLMPLIYDAAFTRDRIAALAPAVVDLARAGDGEALRIVTGAGRDLAMLAVGAARQLFPNSEPVDVYPTGGVFRAGEILLGPFAETLAVRPGLTVRAPRFSPVAGAVIQAKRGLGEPVDEPWLHRLAETLPATTR